MAGKRGIIPEWEKPFYVYMFCEAGKPIYVGKGTRRRLRQQVRNFSHRPAAIGGIVCYFASEQLAYNFEARLIEKHKPLLNKARGGGGAITRNQHIKLSAEFLREKAKIERLGVGRYIACELLTRDLTGFVPPSKIDALRKIAHG